jgi:hypothetical protein
MIIEARYNGPEGSGNGGWSAGLVAAELGATAGAEVTLRFPPPLETPMSVRREDSTVRVYSPDGTLVADAAPAEVEPVGDLAPPVAFEAALAAAPSYSGLVEHPFPTCFVCGPDRAEGDGLRLFPGRLPDGRTAAAWRIPDDVSQVMTWASLDCPGGWAVGVEARPYVLGRIAARVDDVPAPGAECVVVGRLLGAEGRKAYTVTALYGRSGTLHAYARSTWIAIG